MAIGFGLSIKQAKSGFFDRAAVLSAVDKGTRAALSRFGAYVRRTAKDLIRKRKQSAPPGAPPSSHTGLLRRFIFFSYDANARSVVIGPTRLNQKDGTAPSVLEHGGEVMRKVGPVGKQRRIPTRYQARPFMDPAFKANLPKVPDMWANALTK